MTTASLALALIASLALTAQEAEAPKLKKYKSEDGNFSIELPGVPEAQRVPINPDNENAGKQVQYVYGVENGAYLVSYQDNPKLGEAEAKVQEEALKTAQDSLGKTFGKLLSEKPIKLLDKYPGREFEYEIPGQKGRYRSRMYLVDGRLYQVIVVGTEEFASSKTAEAFFNSFGLLR
jgi:hypothetical protein